MNVAELTIIGVYIFFVVPAVLVSLIWAAMLDGRWMAATTHSGMTERRGAPATGRGGAMPRVLAYAQLWRYLRQAGGGRDLTRE